MDHFSAAGIDADREKFRAFLVRRAEPNAFVIADGRRPRATANGSFPGYVFIFAPAEREGFSFGYALTGGTAEFRPVRRACSWRTQQQRGYEKHVQRLHARVYLERI